MTTTEKVLGRDLRQLLVKHIPSFADLWFSELSISLPGQNQEVRVYGERWIHPHCPDDKETEHVEYRLIHSGNRVLSDDFIQELWRIIPSLKDFGCNNITITMKAREIVIAHLESELNFDTRQTFSKQYELECVRP